MMNHHKGRRDKYNALHALRVAPRKLTIGFRHNRTMSTNGMKTPVYIF